jgi:5-dehydro-4-deoxyglucarate dehydratase
MAHRSTEQLRRELKGVFAFPVTPFEEDGELREEALRAHVQWQAGTGVSAVFACAGTGEFFSLAPEEYGRAVGAVVEEVDGRLPVLAGTGYSTRLAIEFARQAEQAGADGLLALPPYLITPEQEGLYQHYRAIAEATPLGLVLYQRDNAIFSPETVRRLAELPNVVGFKDGHGNLELLRRIRLAVGDLLAWMNGMPTAEMTFPAYHAIGVEGYSSAIANFFPHVTLRFHRAVVERDRATADRILAEVVEPICRIRDRGKGYAVSYVKAAMNLLGRPDARGVGPVRPPLTDLRPEEMAALREVLEGIAAAYPA